jgi:hypothetical protein
MYAPATMQNTQANNEQQKLAAERNALIETVRKLNREVAKLESFKKNLMQSLSEETEARLCDVLRQFARCSVVTLAEFQI